MSTTGDRLRNFWGERQTGSGQAADFVQQHWQIGVLLALMALAAGLRLWALGERAIHHDESIHIKFAWDITQNGVMQYVHDPTYHGPFQIVGTAVIFKIGDLFRIPWLSAGDFSGRLFPALFGTALVGLPYFMRDFLGRKGALIAAGARQIDGHAPGLGGRELCAYVASGIGSDHECTTLREAAEKLRMGLFIMIREGSQARNLEALLEELPQV